MIVREGDSLELSDLPDLEYTDSLARKRDDKLTDFIRKGFEFAFEKIKEGRGGRSYVPTIAKLSLG